MANVSFSSEFSAVSHTVIQFLERVISHLFPPTDIPRIVPPAHSHLEVDNVVKQPFPSCTTKQLARRLATHCMPGVSIMLTIEVGPVGRGGGTISITKIRSHGEAQKVSKLKLTFIEVQQHNAVLVPGCKVSQHLWEEGRRRWPPSAHHHHHVFLTLWLWTQYDSMISQPHRVGFALGKMRAGVQRNPVKLAWNIHADVLL